MKNKKVRYMFSIGYVGAVQEETFTLEEIGITEDMTDQEIAEAISEDYETWTQNFIDCGWHFIED